VKKIVGIFALLALLTLFAAACSGGVAGTTGNTIGLTNDNFAQSSITIKKGESITLVNQSSTVHIIANGSWINGNTPDPKLEPGAPVVNNMMFSSANQTETIGPFNTSGTFHYYCSIHPGMNLTVVVQ
jgi:plastocyanin